MNKLEPMDLTSYSNMWGIAIEDEEADVVHTAYIRLLPKHLREPGGCAFEVGAYTFPMAEAI